MIDNINIVAANIISIIVNICYMISKASKSKRKICLWLYIANAIQIVQYILVSAWSGLIVSSMSIIRTYAISKDKLNKKYVIIYGISLAVINITFMESAFGLIALAGALINLYGYYEMQRSIKKYRVILIIGSIPWLAYYVINNLFIAVLFEVAYIIINIISLYKIYKIENNDGEKQNV